MVYLQKSFHDEQTTRFLIKFVRAKTISGPKDPIISIMAAYGPDPKNPYFFYGFPWVNYVFFLRVNYGFLKAKVLFKIRTYGFSMGMYG